MHLVLFLIFAVLCVAGALNLLLQRHPINSALSLIVVMGSLAVLYLMLGAEFVAAVQIIVYAGAIMVLFVFVIMLLNAGEEERTHGSRIAYTVGFPGVAALLALVAWQFLSQSHRLGDAVLGSFLVTTHNDGSPGATALPMHQAGLYDISPPLFRDLLLPFEVTSVLVLIAILGAVVLARKEQ